MHFGLFMRETDDVCGLAMDMVKKTKIDETSIGTENKLDLFVGGGARFDQRSLIYIDIFRVTVLN